MKELKISFVIFLNPSMQYVCCFQQSWPLPVAAFQIRYVDSKQHLQTFLEHIHFMVHSSPGPAFTPGLSNAIKSLPYKNAKYDYSYNRPRRSVTIRSKGKWWFIAARSAPNKVSNIDVESLHITIGTRDLEAALIAKAVLLLSWGWWWMSPLGDLGSLENMAFVNILNTCMYSY